MQKRLMGLLRIPLQFALFLSLGLLFGFLTFKILSFSRTVEVPTLSGMTMVEANEALSSAGLYLKIEGEDYDPAVTAGKIIRQDIPPGHLVKERRAIKVVVSKGPRISSVPSVLDETLPDAESTLMNKGLRIGKVIQIHSDTVEKGRIAVQRPGPDEQLSDTITVLVSLGPHEFKLSCPDFIGRTIEDAEELAGKVGLLPKRKGSGRTVVGQQPKAGIVVKNGDDIILETGEAQPDG